jgi:hypothetical protein
VSGGEFGVERKRAFEVEESLVAAVEDGKKEPDLVLDAGGIGVECGGLLPGGERGGSVTAGTGGGGSGFEVPELGLLGREKCSGSQYSQ